MRSLHPPRPPRVAPFVVERGGSQGKETEHVPRPTAHRPLAALVLSAGAALTAAPPTAAGTPASAAFERFKALAGEWVAALRGLLNQ